MNRKQFTVSALAATLALGAAATPSLARDMRGPAPERGFIYLLKTSDANKDGKITEDEVVAFQDGRFEEIDVNGDGVITPGEFADFRKAERQAFRDANPRPQGKMAATDAAPAKPSPGGKMAAQNGGPDGMPGPDGKPGRKMANNEAGPKGMNENAPRRMAMNGDGPQHRMDGRDRDGKNWDGKKWGGRPGNVERIFFVRADTDRSGQVSQEEFAQLAAKMFSRMDRNGDMVITVEDLPDRRPMR
ncbi:EF-hand domain-containing protein [Martelella mediterranea]|uniref:EF-hand domain-containing protein n=1 Tax=Martelella mediterranea TaxID=293089 RepID=UPI001E578568|nr:EF-hand domain-containing protein [Martelella mediterranea]MCD1633415.1 EF-hand domain-containing protein [Martelella mediterranea]